jgi:uncharacterized protein (TIGR02265 family)
MHHHQVRVPSEFEPVDFDADVPLEVYLRECPASATTRGTFFQYVAELARGANGAVDGRIFAGITDRRWVPFKSYPLRDFMRLCHNATKLAYPALSTGEALRRVGWVCYPSFAATMAGRIVLFAFGMTLEDVLLAAPKSYEHGLSGSAARTTRVGDRHFHAELRGVYSFAGTYHVGVVEGAIRAFGYQPDIRLRVSARRCDVDLDIHWREIAAR